MPKITLIGAGSVVFAKTLIGDILQFPELSDATICLMDIDPDRLKVADVMARKMVAKLGVKARIESTLNQLQAVRGADYVICTIQVGGYKPGTVIDFEIPRKYGVEQTIGDTLGVGGVFRALRTIPVINSIAQDIARVGRPGCLLLNYTNPMAMNCWAVDRGVGIPHVGLCHSVQGTSQQLAAYAGLPYKDISYLVAGINHMAFFLKFEYRGQDAYPLLFQLLNDPTFKSDRVRFEMMRRLGYFVTESSEHQSEYVPYFIHHGRPVIEKFDIPIDEYLRRCEAIMACWKESEKQLLGGKGEIDISPSSHEYGSFIIHSRETGVPRVIYGNVPNRSLITNLPEGCCVEVPCLVDRNGIQPSHIGDLPPQLAAICRSNINVQELTVEAALTSRRDYVYQAVMMDPHTSTVLPLDKIWAMCDDLIAAHQKVGLLGEFKPVINGTGKPQKGTGDRVIVKIKTLEPARENTRELACQLEVENGGSDVFEWTPAIKPDESGVKIVMPAGRIKVRGGQRGIKTFKIRTPGGVTKPFRLEINSNDLRILGVGAEIRPRHPLPDLGGGKYGFECALAGFPAVKGMLQIKKTTLALVVDVQDSKVHSVGSERPWEGSCIELFFAPLQKNIPVQLFCMPGASARRPQLFDLQRKTIPGAQVRQFSKGAGYRMEVEIPFKSAGLVSGESFLFDMIVNLMALGDAHSGGRTSLSGRFDSSATTQAYSIVG